jgi:ubiquinol-cytochrome c reductase iron-sulfur subunit
VLNRTPEVLATLATLDSKLADPQSFASSQPEDSKNSFRSIKPEIFVAVGLCTHLGCSPTFRPEIAPNDLGEDWKGGFFCPCHGSWFDLAGRVYRGVPAPTNLEVPPYRYITDSLIIIGEEIEENRI